MFETLDKIDEGLFITLHHIFRGDFMDSSMWWISHRWVWVPMYIALAYWIFRKYGWKQWLVLTVSLLIAVACSDILCAKVIRPLVERLRPTNLDNPISSLVYIVNDHRGGSYGFPSCHAANTFALASFVAMMCRSRGVVFWMFTWALLNCFSRIYLGVHYPGDLLAGAFIGSFFGIVCWYLAKRLSKKYNFGKITYAESKWYTPFVCVGYLTLGIIVCVSIF